MQMRESLLLQDYKPIPLEIETAAARDLYVSP
jgi:hypothetical protein